MAVKSPEEKALLHVAKGVRNLVRLEVASQLEGDDSLPAPKTRVVEIKPGGQSAFSIPEDAAVLPITIQQAPLPAPNPPYTEHLVSEEPQTAQKPSFNLALFALGGLTAGIWTWLILRALGRRRERRGERYRQRRQRRRSTHYILA